MNETDIKKCIKNGYYWYSGGGIPNKINWFKYGIVPFESLKKDNAHATKREAQAALDKAKQPEHKFAESVASHATPSDESQAKEVSTDETQTILEEAMKCVCCPRRRDYGTPDENFARIAALWSIQLKKQITVDDVAMCMILMKVARQANTPKRDNLVDIAGYAQCASELTHNK